MTISKEFYKKAIKWIYLLEFNNKKEDIEKINYNFDKFPDEVSGEYTNEKEQIKIINLTYLKNIDIENEKKQKIYFFEYKNEIGEERSINAMFELEEDVIMTLKYNIENDRYNFYDKNSLSFRTLYEIKYYEQDSNTMNYFKKHDVISLINASFEEIEIISKMKLKRLLNHKKTYNSKIEIKEFLNIKNLKKLNKDNLLFERFFRNCYFKYKKDELSIESYDLNNNFDVIIEKIAKKSPLYDRAYCTFEYLDNLKIEKKMKNNANIYFFKWVSRYDKRLSFIAYIEFENGTYLSIDYTIDKDFYSFEHEEINKTIKEIKDNNQQDIIFEVINIMESDKYLQKKDRKENEEKFKKIKEYIDVLK